MNRRLRKRIRIRMKTRILRQIVANTVREFCSNTTIHGFRYFTESNLSWIERIWWVVSIVVLFILCTIATLKIWSTWEENPVFVSFDDKTTSIATIPFPAVTICSTQKIDEEKLNANDFQERLYSYKPSINLTSDDISDLNVLVQLCFIDRTKKFLRIPTAPCKSIYERIKYVAPSSIYTIPQSEFNEENVRLAPIFTERGLCYTFNALNSRDIYSDEVATELLTIDWNPSANWNVDDGYVTITNEADFYPKRALGTKSRDIFHIILGFRSDKFNSPCPDYPNKFYFALHSPDELPRMAEDFMLIQKNQELHVIVIPFHMKTSDGLRGYSPKARGCFFKSERKLQFFKKYSRNHCGLECLANFTKNECGCIPFYLPRDNATEACTMFDFDCYSVADFEFAKQQHADKCNCLPDCTMLTYNAFSSHAQLNDDGNKEDKDFPISEISILYKQQHFIGLTRLETSTMTEFVASFGGLLGLFMGVSILSVIELIYYFTVRLFFKIRRGRMNRVEPVVSIG